MALTDNVLARHLLAEKNWPEAKLSCRPLPYSVLPRARRPLAVLCDAGQSVKVHTRYSLGEIHLCQVAFTTEDRIDQWIRNTIIKNCELHSEMQNG